METNVPEESVPLNNETKIKRKLYYYPEKSKSYFKKKKENDPDWYEKVKERNRIRLKEKYRNDSEFRAADIARRLKRKAENPEQAKAAIERAEIMRREKLISQPIHQMLIWVKCRAKRQNVAFDLKSEDITIPEFCPVLSHIKLVPFGDCSNECSWSLDKIIPEFGYVKGNVRIISRRANRLKSDASLAELKAIIDYIERETNKNV